MINRNTIVALALATGAILLDAAALWSFSFAHNALVYVTYFFLLALTTVWLWAFSEVIRSKKFFGMKSFLFEHRWGFGFCVAITAIFFITVKPGFRVLSDETNLLSVAQSIANERTVYNTTMGQWYYERFYPLNQEVPTRPNFFPFLISLTHDFFGYRYENGFFTNGMLACSILMMVYLIFQRLCGVWIGIAAVLWISSQPLFAMCATSAGFEICNVWIFLICLISLAEHLRNPRIESAIFLWYSLIVSAHVRYENILYIPIFFFVAFRFDRLLWKFFLDKGLIHLCAGLFLLTPRFWQMIRTKGMYENGAKELLDVSRVPARLWGFLNASFDFGFHFPYAALTNLLLVLGLMVYVWVHMSGAKRHISKDVLGFLIAATLCFFLYLSITCSHFLADAQHPSVFRLYLLPTVLMTMGGFYGCLALRKNFQDYVFVCVGLLLFLLYLPVATDHAMSKSLTLVRATNEIYRYLDKLNDSRVLLVIDRPGQYTVRNTGAVDFQWASSRVDQLMENLKSGLFSRILVVQEVGIVDKKPRESLRESITTHPVYEFQNDGLSKIVISEVSPR